MYIHITPPVCKGVKAVKHPFQVTRFHYIIYIFTYIHICIYT